MRVVAVNGNEAEVEQGGTKLRVRVDLVEDVRVGDYVLVHAGFAIQKLDEEEAFETLRLLEMLGMSPLDDGTSMSNVE
jgi:hydrogenase expression/formation protein HypC